MYITHIIIFDMVSFIYHDRWGIPGNTSMKLAWFFAWLFDPQDVCLINAPFLDVLMRRRLMDGRSACDWDDHIRFLAQLLQTDGQELTHAYKIESKMVKADRDGSRPFPFYEIVFCRFSKGQDFPTTCEFWTVPPWRFDRGLGCRLGCPCHWLEHCAPRYELATGHGVWVVRNSIHDCGCKICVRR